MVVLVLAVFGENMFTAQKNGGPVMVILCGKTNT